MAGGAVGVDGGVTAEYAADFVAAALGSYTCLNDSSIINQRSGVGRQDVHAW
jgi:hypothetical protein